MYKRSLFSRLLVGLLLVALMLPAYSVMEEVDPFGYYEEPVSITSVLAYAPPTDPALPKDISPDNFSFIHEAKRRFNIDYSFKWTAPMDQYDQKFGVALVSGDLPDVMVVSPVDYKILLDNDLLQDWNEALKYASPTTHGYIYRDGGESLKGVTVDGKVMAIPEYWDQRREMNLMIIRQDWLDELGLEAPKTTDELLDVLRAFKEKKGAKQALAIDVDWTHNPAGIMMSFGAYVNAWLEKDGSLVSGAIQPEVKDALAFLNQAYQEGLIAPDFATYDANKSTELLISGEVGVVYGPWWFYEYAINQSVAKDKSAFWTAHAIPTAPGDVGRALVSRNATGDRYYVISKDSKHPEAAMKLMNLYVEGNAMGEDWVKSENGHVWSWCVPRYTDPFDIMAMYEQFADLQAKDPEGQGREPFPNAFELLGIYPDYLKWKQGDREVEVVSGAWGTLMARLDPDFGWGTSIKVAAEGKLAYNEFSGAPTEGMGERGPTLTTLMNETFIKIIMGAEPLDNFDSFVTQWKALGGDQITQEVNDWYQNK